MRIALVILEWKIKTHASFLEFQKTWDKRPLSVFLIYVFLYRLFVWSFHSPSPGKAVTDLAVAAAVMTLMGEMRGKEKVAWILLLFEFLFVESHSIDVERRAHEQEQSETQRGIEATEKRITENNSKITQVLEKVDAQGQKIMAAWAEIHKLYDEEGRNGKDNIERIKKQIDAQISASRTVLDTCSSVSPPMQGGIAPYQCTNLIAGWTNAVRSYISENLDDQYANRFEEAGQNSNLKSERETKIDLRVVSEIDIPIRGVENRVRVLKNFIQEIRAKQRSGPSQ